jgi:hypothetical protein
MFSLPQNEKMGLDGSSAEHPLVLEDIELAHMKAFIRAAMRAMYVISIGHSVTTLQLLIKSMKSTS